MNHLRNYKTNPSRDCLCCLATSNSKIVIISVMFDKLPYFGHISSKGPTLDFGLYALLLFIESKKISNDQELIQSDPISCPQNQKGNN